MSDPTVSPDRIAEALKAERAAADLSAYYDGSQDTGRDYRKAQKKTDKVARKLLAEVSRLTAQIAEARAALADKTETIKHARDNSDYPDSHYSQWLDGELEGLTFAARALALPATETKENEQ